MSRTLEQIEKYNEDINDAIYLSQMMDHPGYLVLQKYLLTKKQDIRFQDIFGLKPENLSEQKGIALMIEDLLTYFTQQKNLALVPKINPETGENEILNNKKE